MPRSDILPIGSKVRLTSPAIAGVHKVIGHSIITPDYTPNDARMVYLVELTQGSYLRDIPDVFIRIMAVHSDNLCEA